MSQINLKLLNRTNSLDALKGLAKLPENCIDIVVTSPPYWGQRTSMSIGEEEDPRDYLSALECVFNAILTKLKPAGILWVNLGDSYNTPVNWRRDDYVYSTLGTNKRGHDKDNAAYTKKRFRRKQFVRKDSSWLKYGNLLGLTHRMSLRLVDLGYYYRGEVIWAKKNAMPEGKCRRPHRTHEPIYLFAKSERHQFQTNPGVKSVWEIAMEPTTGIDHCSKFPLELARKCISSYGLSGEDVVVLDPFAGSGTTGVAAHQLNCSYIGFEIDSKRARDANKRLKNEI